MDIVLLPRDRQALLERTPRRVLVQFPKREDARTVQGARSGDGPRLGTGCCEGFRQPGASLVRVPSFFLERPHVRGELERLGSFPMSEKPGERGLQPRVIALQSVHPRRAVRPPKVRLRLRGERKQPLRAASLPRFPRHVVPLSESTDRYFNVRGGGKTYLTPSLFRRVEAEETTPRRSGLPDGTGPVFPNIASACRSGFRSTLRSLGAPTSLPRMRAWKGSRTSGRSSSARRVPSSSRISRIPTPGGIGRGKSSRCILRTGGTWTASAIAATSRPTTSSRRSRTAGPGSSSDGSAGLLSPT